MKMLKVICLNVLNAKLNIGKCVWVDGKGNPSFERLGRETWRNEVYAQGERNPFPPDHLTH